MKILVVGSKGFIGTHVTERFKELGHETFGCDVVVEYNDPFYFQVDASNSSYEEIFVNNIFDVCVNCSGAASVPDSLKHPLRDFNLNVHNVYVILDAIRKHNDGCKFINVSSAAIYGNPNVLPVQESAIISPISPYGFHKSYSEQICREFNRFYNIQTCNVRIFSAYGPGLQKQLFWDLFLRWKKHGKLELLGTGDESRDFIFINDIVKGIELIIHSADFSAGIYNLASGEETTIRVAVETFAACFNKPVDFSFSNEVRKGDPLNWRADITKIKSLGFMPQFSLSDGLKRYVEWLLKEKK